MIVQVWLPSSYGGSFFFRGRGKKSETPLCTGSLYFGAQQRPRRDYLRQQSTAHDFDDVAPLCSDMPPLPLSVKMFINQQSAPPDSSCGLGCQDARNSAEDEQFAEGAASGCRVPPFLFPTAPTSCRSAQSPRKTPVESSQSLPLPVSRRKRDAQGDLQAAIIAAHVGLFS